MLLGGLIAFGNLVKVNLIGNAIAHGALSVPILKGFALSLSQCAVAHPITAGVLTAAGFIGKTVIAFLV
ncbi:hypothetical protein M9Y10_019646 [Tritrichomonas musculus]|uniref:Uncharacterized protein n=1 Tax=Tritrichomonas musculus TaxID=1915356 RepID=A0ABR2HGZ7_9EUKA